MEHPIHKLLETLLNLASGGVLDRIDNRAKRARELRQWGLHPHHPESGSPLAADDTAFKAAYPLVLAGDSAVTEESLFPMMNATENLYAAASLVEERSKTRDLYASSIMQLCRSAMETSARTIWLLSDPDRDVRCDRCMSIEMEQLEQQSYFLKLEAEFEKRGRNPRPQNMIDDNVAHRANHAALLKRIKAAYSYNKPPSFTKTITQAAKWVDEHVPPHDTGELAQHGLEQGARSFYSYGSSFVHGYSWMSDYARGGVLFGMIADGLAAALNMTECAVCLYEAACRAPGGQRAADSHVPERLEPTIGNWSRELFTT
ncbi:hypothetical protein A5677_23280 [Mycobacterium malmoense]|uniref:Uncharacterized protein n=2 Tax=Mycobacterium malmoense TaxID=1780 RepID=A0A1B9D698_MYCMA|nr:hypothetical protein A5677_23280 [Mycobacterium malmoense]